MQLDVLQGGIIHSTFDPLISNHSVAAEAFYQGLEDTKVLVLEDTDNDTVYVMGKSVINNAAFIFKPDSGGE